MDDGAFGKELVGERDMLLKWCRKKFRLSTDDAEDAVQETICKAWSVRASYDDQQKIRAWLMTILANQIISKKRRAWREILTGNDIAFERGTSGGQEDALYLQQVLTKMCLLPPDQIDAMIFLARGEQYHETGEMLDVANGTIKSRVSRGRKTLAEALGEK